MGTGIKRKEKKRQKGIVFVADHWCEFYGGIDVFNQKLCEAMAYVVEQSKIKVVCLVFGSVLNDDIYEYGKRGIIVIQYNKGERQVNQEDYKRALNLVKNSVPDVEFTWIGHDIKTGEIAHRLARNNNEKCAVIFHTIYDSMHSNRKDIMQRTKEGRDHSRIDDQQCDLARQVDWVFCVGPVLYESFNALEQNNIYEIIPGLEEKQSNVAKHNRIMIGGRYSKNNSEQKNWKMACFAVVKALNDLSSNGIICPGEFTTYVYGFESDYTDAEIEKIENDVKEEIKKEHFTKHMPEIHFKKFNKNRKEYLKDLEKSKLFVMSSAKESFGLVAWEALAYEIPVVVSCASGIYKYLSEELGYLLNGLCGTFEPSSTNLIDEMGESIANILKNTYKMEKSTRLLRNEMDKNKWEILAIDIANKMGINEVMNPDIFTNAEYAEFTYAKRKLMLDELKRRFRNGKIERQVVFFGGISRGELLLDEDFLMSILEWLPADSHKNMDVFFCYEIDEAINQRAIQLKEDKNANRHNLCKKAEDMANFKNILINLYQNRNKNIEMQHIIEKGLERIHLVTLKKCPSVYINILDDDWYFTLKYENRSTQNATVKLSKDYAGNQQKHRLIDHMKFILSDSEGDSECDLLLREIEKWR